MPTFPTPEPVALRLRIQAGSVTVAASERADTVVDVHPSNPSSDADIEHAAATVVEQRGAEVLVIAPEVKKLFGRGPSIDVAIRLPERSTATITASSADVRLTGTLGAVDVTTASGDVSVEHASTSSISVASGEVVCERTDGNLTVKSASGNVRFVDVGGRAAVTTASGDIVGTRIDGDVEVRTASGEATVDWVGGSASVRTASGDVRLGSIRVGTVEADSASGDIAIGVANGSAAWLDVRSISGDVTSSLDEAGPPEDGADVVSIHARTLSGDVIIRRAPFQ